MLRPVEWQDLPLRTRWINDPRVQQTLNFDWPTSLARTEDWFRRAAADSCRRDFSILESNRNVYVGFAGLRDLDWRTRKAEVYVTIGNPDYWGRGLGSEAYAVLAQYAFRGLGLERLYQTQLLNNNRAAAATEAKGWVVEGVLRRNRFHHGAIVDEKILSLLRSEWLNSPDE